MPPPPHTARESEHPSDGMLAHFFPLFPIDSRTSSHAGPTRQTLTRRLGLGERTSSAEGKCQICQLPVSSIRELSVCVCLGWVGVFLLPASFLCNPRTGNMPTGSFITLLPNNALFLIFLHVQGEKRERSQPLPAMVMMLSTLLHSCQQFWSPLFPVLPWKELHQKNGNDPICETGIEGRGGSVRSFRSFHNECDRLWDGNGGNNRLQIRKLECSTQKKTLNPLPGFRSLMHCAEPRGWPFPAWQFSAAGYGNETKWHTPGDDFPVGQVLFAAPLHFS